MVTHVQCVSRIEQSQGRCQDRGVADQSALAASSPRSRSNSLPATNRYGLYCGMFYVPAQVREALGISEETLRHWRGSLEPLSGRRGYGPCFSPRDLLALKVIAQLHQLGIPMRRLRSSAQQLFDLCDQGPWFALAERALVFYGESFELLRPTELAIMPPITSVLIPLRPLIDALHASLAESPPAQPEIAFPPQQVGSSRS